MKKFIIIVITLLVLSNTYLLYNNYNLKKQVLSYEEKSNIRRKNAISMMLETESNSKTYVQSTDNKWPTDGYIFNEEMSKCEQGSKLKWDDNNQKVIMEGNVSDKCYVFFDKYNPIKINSSSVSANGNNIVITVNATSGTGSISKYFYSKDNGLNYVESTSNTYTFANLPIGKYDVKFYVMDSNGKKSETISKNIEINGINLSKYIISKYTGTQGENGIYYHNSSLTNGAGDNSYRYAGASDQVNNYVCFGSSTTPCPADNLYRIIGVFGDKVKLIKSDYATTALLGGDGDYKQAYTATGYDSSSYKGNNLANIAAYNWNKSNQNTWSLSNLNKTNLNTNFITNIGADWAAKIAETTWKVGGNTDAKIRDAVPSVAYQNEIVNPVTSYATDNATTYSAKVGLMYVSDYGFAAAPSAWTTNLYDYNGAAIKSVNWMYMGLLEWTISRRADNASGVFGVGITGFVSSYSASNALGVRPVFNLSSSVNYVSGSGTAADPILVN